MYNNCEMCFVSHRVAGQVCLGGTKILNKFNSIQFNISGGQLWDQSMGMFSPQIYATIF